MPGQPGAPPQPARPNMAAAGFGGVADLIDEEINRQVNKKIQEEDEEIRREAKEKAWNELMAPKMKSLEMQKKGLSAAIHRKLNIGSVFARSWRVFSGDFGRILGITWCGLLIMLIPMALIVFTMQFLFLALVAWLGQQPGMQESVAYVIAFVICFFATLIAGLVLDGAIGAWMLAGQTRFLMSRIKGKDAEFADLFRGGSQLLSFWGGGFMLGLISLMPEIADVLVFGIGFICGLTGVELEGTVRSIILLTAGGTKFLLWLFSQVLILKSVLFPWAIIDRNARAGEALGVSQELTTGNVGKIISLYLTICTMNLLGLATCCIGFIVIIPFQMVLWGVTYAELSGIEEPLPGQVEQPT